MKIFNQKGLKKCVYKQFYNLNETKLKDLTMNLMLTCFTQKCVGEKPLLQNKKKGQFKKILLKS